MTTQTQSNPLDPNALFNQLVKESQEAQAQSGDAGQGTKTDDGTNKTASDNKVVFDKTFFQKVAADDKDALAALHKFSSDALAAGNSPEEISAQISAMETEAMKEGEGGAAEGDKPTDGANANTAGKDGEGQNDDADDEFEAAAEQAEAEAVNNAIDHELANNDLAKAAGIDRDAIETWMIAERAGAAYFNGRDNTRQLVEEIAEKVLPSDPVIEGAIEVAKTAGLDVSKIEAEVNDFKKQASTAAPAESDAAKKAREAAEAEQMLVESLSVLKIAGYNVDDLVKAAEEGKKMGKGKLMGAAALGAGAGVGGTMLAKKYGPGAMNMVKSRLGKK